MVNNETNTVTLTKSAYDSMRSMNDLVLQFLENRCERVPEWFDRKSTSSGFAIYWEV